jgi:hypothetical protein
LGTLPATISGAYDMMSALGYKCRDKGVNRGQVRDVVLKYMRENPQDRHVPAVFLIAIAGETLLGCKRD